MGKIQSTSISNARHRLSSLIEEVETSSEPYFIVCNSKIKAVLIGITQYNVLLERIEDLEDSLEISLRDLRRCQWREP
ncbi:MAG: type II toxin-antitoxin system Phd/YefM family antitoxin [Dehalococcoidia bacterium]